MKGLLITSITFHQLHFTGVTVKLLFVITRFRCSKVIFHILFYLYTRVKRKSFIILRTLLYQGSTVLQLKENCSLYWGLCYIKVLLFCNDSYLRAVAKISICQVNAVSRRGIVLSCVGISSFGSVFVLFPIREARAYTHSTQVKSPAPPGS